MNDLHGPRQFATKCARKEDEFVDIRQPLRNKCAGEFDVAEERCGLNQFRFNAGRGQALQHHRRESLHTLLLIGRIITDQ